MISSTELKLCMPLHTSATPAHFSITDALPFSVGSRRIVVATNVETCQTNQNIYFCLHVQITNTRLREAKCVTSLNLLVVNNIRGAFSCLSSFTQAWLKNSLKQFNFNSGAVNEIYDILYSNSFSVLALLSTFIYSSSGTGVHYFTYVFLH